MLVLGRGSPAASGGESPAAAPEVGGPGPLPHQGGTGGGDGGNRDALCACSSRAGGLRGGGYGEASYCLYPSELGFDLLAFPLLIQLFVEGVHSADRKPGRGRLLPLLRGIIF
jgi:hypothetical protein